MRSSSTFAGASGAVSASALCAHPDGTAPRPLPTRAISHRTFERNCRPRCARSLAGDLPEPASRGMLATLGSVSDQTPARAQRALAEPGHVSAALWQVADSAAGSTDGPRATRRYTSTPLSCARDSAPGPLACEFEPRVSILRSGLGCRALGSGLVACRARKERRQLHGHAQDAAQPVPADAQKVGHGPVCNGRGARARSCSWF